MEITDFAINETNSTFVPIRVGAIYNVLASNKYKIKHSKIDNSLVLVAVTNGSGTINVNNCQYTLSSGQVFLFDASKHSFNYHSNDNNWNFWWIEFSTTDDDFIDIERSRILNRPLMDMEIGLLTRALDALKFRDEKTASYLFASVLCLLKNNAPLDTHNNKITTLIRTADNYIRTHIASVTPKAIATLLNISARTLFTIFKENTGISPSMYIQNIRLELAKYYLQNNDLTIKSIAEQLGYPDPFTFSKCFKRKYGIPPLTFKRNNDI